MYSRPPDGKDATLFTPIGPSLDIGNHELSILSDFRDENEPSPRPSPVRCLPIRASLERSDGSKHQKEVEAGVPTRRAAEGAGAG